MCARIEECMVIDVLGEQAARNHGLLQARQLELVLQCDESLTGYFDSDLVGGVINNILVNCARYSTHQLILSAQQVEEGICITVEDDGPGYPQEMLNASTFAETRTSFSSGRTHLGLMFANKVALMHRNKVRQGFIRLTNDSSLGGGRFRLYLP